MAAEAQDGAPRLSVRGLTRRFGALAAVDELSFDALPGEVLGIGGPNGAGKTTLFDLVSGLERADAGSVALDGREVTRASAERICHLGVSRTFQLNAAFDSMSVEDNIYCAAYYGTRNVIFPKLWIDRGVQRRVDEMMGLVGLAGEARTVAGELPVLSRKLLMVACALVSRPKLLLMDEPVGGLNPNEVDEMLSFLQRIRHELGLTILVIEHVMRFLTALSDRVMILHHGQKIYEGSVDGLTSDKTVVEVYLGQSARGQQEQRGRP